MVSHLKEVLKERMSYGLKEAARQVRAEWILFRLHRREIKKVPRFLQAFPVKLNLGCGPNRKDSWVNVDLFDSTVADLRLDLRNPWPFPDNSVAYIYSEHVFEHFEIYVEVPHSLGEALRVLEPGGISAVAVPDTVVAVKAYGDPGAEFWALALAKDWHPGCQTQMEHINHLGGTAPIAVHSGKEAGSQGG